MALALNGDVALGQQRAVDFDLRIEAADGAAADRRPIVLEHGLTLDHVLEMFAAPDFDFDADPTIAAIRLGLRVEAVALDHRAVHEDFGPGRADVGRGPIAGRPAA